MYSFAQRSDTLVIDEPLYGHYLLNSDADHPGREEIISSMECNPKKILSDIIFGNYEKEIVFMKQMTHHLVNFDESFLYEVDNVFLIRDPEKLIRSLSRVLKKVELRDTGIKRQNEIYRKLKSVNHAPVVIDSGEILRNPENVISRLCSALNIPFEKNMLSWEPGPRKEDGIWAKYWYGSVHKSSGFQEQNSGTEELPESLKNLYDECIQYYSELYSISIKAN